MRIGQLFEFQSELDWVEASAKALFSVIEQILVEKGEVWLALSGGITPYRVYSKLAEQIKQLDLDVQSKINIILVDERSVIYTDAASNTAAIDSSFRNTRVDLHRMHSPETPCYAAIHYSRMVNTNRPDIIVLGMGEDGHTASLFPGSNALKIANAAYVVTESPVEPKTRISMTFPVIQSVPHRFVLIRGRVKREMVEQLEEGAQPDWPIDRVVTDGGALLNWYWCP